MPTADRSTKSIRIDSRGRWLHEGDPIASAVAQQFAKHVALSTDGHYELAWDCQRQAIEVEDTPYFVRNAQVHREDGRILAIDLDVSDGTRERLNPTTLMQAGEHILYCRIERNGFSVPCRFAPSLYHLLAEYIEEARGSYVLPIAGQAYPIRPYAGEPLKAN